MKLSVKEEDRKRLFIAQYRIPQALMPFAEKIIKRWLELLRIEPFKGDDRRYNCPILLVPKRDENGNMTGVRICIDPRMLNKVLEEDDHFEIPRINDMLAQFAGKRLFGEMDLKEAFMQFQLTEESRKYTAFTWNQQQLQFRSVPYGIKHIPSHFQRCMTSFFQDMAFCFPYIDNIIFASDTWGDHEQHAAMIIARLIEKNLQLKPGSVNIGHSQLKVLGRIISSFGMSMDADKRQAVMDWPQPVDGANLHSLLGFTGFLADHIRNYAEITAPLQKMKMTKGPIKWDPLSLAHLDLLKRAVANAPWLKYPDFDREFFIACDASNTGIGGVLYQPDDGSTEITPHNIIAICSRKLTDTETRYSAYKKELRALVYCLSKFHSWIALRKFTIVTDHNPLIHMLTQKQLSNSLQQWLDVIVQYQFDIRHRPGIMHVVPDALSRLYAATYADSSLVWGTHNHIKFIETADKFETKSDSVVRDSIAADPKPKAPPLRPRFQSGGGKTGGGSECEKVTVGRITTTQHDDGSTTRVCTDVGPPPPPLQDPDPLAPGPCVCSVHLSTARPAMSTIRFLAGITVSHVLPISDMEDGVEAEFISEADYLDQEASIQYGAGACWQVCAIELAAAKRPRTVVPAAAAAPPPADAPVQPAPHPDAIDVEVSDDDVEVPPRSTPSSPVAASPII